MCIACWEEMGRPAAFTPNTMAAVDAVRRLYEVNGVGGGAHIVTDDWNLEDEHVTWCLENLAARDDPPEELEAARSVLGLFQPMTEPERATVLAVADGFLPDPAEAKH